MSLNHTATSTTSRRKTPISRVGYSWSQIAVTPLATAILTESDPWRYIKWSLSRTSLYLGNAASPYTYGRGRRSQVTTTFGPTFNMMEGETSDRAVKGGVRARLYILVFRCINVNNYRLYCIVHTLVLQITHS